MINTHVTIRPAILDDAQAVAEVYLASRHQLVSCAPLAHTDDEINQWIRKCLIPKQKVVVATLKQNIVGMMVLSDDKSSGWIDHLYVYPTTTRQGVGTHLLEFAKAELGAPIRLYTFQANKVSRRFYEQHSFKPISFTDGADNEEHRPDVLYEWRPAT